MADKRKPVKDGIYPEMGEIEYHSDPFSISKSGLWTFHSKTPAHFKYAPPREREPQLDFGNAVHLAVLEPGRVAKDLIRGPDDRRGNKWKDALAELEDNPAAVLVPGPMYEEVMQIAEAAHKHPVIRKLIDGPAETTKFEASAFWHDKETGLQCRCRPDVYAGHIKIIGDLKTTADASQWNWSRTAANLGYHVQEAMYSEGWEAAGGGEVEGFVFICIESKAPFLPVVYEFEPSAATEGQQVFHKALAAYKVCLENDEWPGYPTEVIPQDIPQFSYRETDSPNLAP